MADLECLMCSYKWLPRKVGKPRKCPRCQSFTWDTGVRAIRQKQYRYFVPPTAEEVKKYFKESGWSGVDAQGYYGWHAGKGWPGIVDWKAAALGWMARERKEK